MKPRKLKVTWGCSDFIHHEHRWRFTAWLCGRWQAFREEIRLALPCRHLWVTRSMGGSPDDAGSYERVVYCDRCGTERTES